MTSIGGTAVCVIGPGRSGTSLTMRMLSILGVYAGSEDGFIVSRRGNPANFWERTAIARLNNRLLRLHGGDVLNPPRLPPGWESAKSVAAERRAASALLADTFGGHDLWGWKCPRASLTLPFWQQLIPDLRYVICVRNPIDMARSLAELGGVPREQALSLWLTYTATAMVNTSGKQRTFVRYADYFDDWRPVVGQLAGLLGSHSGATETGEVAELIESAIDEGLRHHEVAAHELMSDAQIPAELAALFLIVTLIAGGEHWPHEQRQDLELAADAYALRLLSEKAT